MDKITALQGFNQIRCEKHELILVTQTTTTSGFGEPKIETKQWMQCKNCSYTVDLPKQLHHHL